MVISIKKLLYLFLPLISGSLIGLLISNFMNYSGLTKPPLSPPGIVFPIAWTIIYILMGISYLLFKSNTFYTKEEDKIYYSQLIVNLSWSIFFFIFKWYFFSIIWTILLLILVIILIIKFYNKYKLSAYLNIPYLIWLIFAIYLTVGVYLLN